MKLIISLIRLEPLGANGSISCLIVTFSVCGWVKLRDGLTTILGNSSKMKAILKRSKTSIYIIAMYIIVFLLYNFIGNPIIEYCALSPKKALMPKGWYMFFTYSFIHIGWGHLIGVCARLLCIGLIIEPRISRFYFRLLLVGSLFLGGGFYCIINQGSAVPFIGSGFVLAALGGALIATWIKSKNDFNRWENFYTRFSIVCFFIYVIIAVIIFLFGKFALTPPVYSKLLSFAGGWCYILYLSKYYKIGLKEVQTKTDVQLRN